MTHIPYERIKSLGSSIHEKKTIFGNSITGYKVLLEKEGFQIDYYPICDGNVHIEIDKTERKKTNNKCRIELAGWAADFNYMLPPKCIFILKNGVIINVIDKFLSRPDVRLHINAHVDNFGFLTNIGCTSTDILKFAVVSPDDRMLLHNIEP
jgi:hypothetical protein